MSWVERLSAHVDRVAIAARVDPFLTVVATLAKALQLARHERLPRAAMADDMIDDRRRDDESLPQAHLAQRLRAQLMGAAPLPRGKPIPDPSPIADCAWIGKASGHRNLFSVGGSSEGSASLAMKLWFRAY
jgi:hypothetical protein